MATINHYGPYYLPIPEGLAPGKFSNWRWSEVNGNFEDATFNVTGTPWETTTGGFSAVWVSDMSMASEPVFGGPSNVFMYATFGNDGSTTITKIKAYLTVTRP